MEHVAKYFQKTIEICLIILREFSAEKKMFHLCFRFNFWFVRYLPRIIFLLQEIPLECTTINIYQYLTKYSSHRSSFFLVRVFFFVIHTVIQYFDFFHCAIVRKLVISPGLILLWFWFFVMTLFLFQFCIVQSCIPFFVPKAFLCLLSKKFWYHFW